MIRTALLALALPLMAAPAGPAPQQAPGDVALSDASAEEVSKALAAAGGAEVRAGEWELRVQALAINLGEPSVQATVDAGVQSMDPIVATQCVTPADAKRGATEIFFPSDHDCRYASYTLTGGRLDARAVCTTQMGKLTAHMTGTLASDRFDVDSDTAMEMTTATPEIVDGKPVFPRNSNAPTQKSSVRARMSGHWTGACDSK